MAQVMAWPLNLETYYYNAQDVMRWMAGKTSGIYGQEGNWQVQHKSGMTVTVKAEGMLGGWLTNMSLYGIGFWSASDIDLTVWIGDGAYPRIDRVVVSWHIPNQTDLPVVEIRKGTPGAEPVAPELVNDGEYAEICLAEIAVAAGAIEISAQDITDTRLDESLCGLVSMGLEKYPTDGLNEQFQDWFADLKSQLSGDVAANLQRQIDEVMAFAKSRPVVSLGTARAESWTELPPYTNTVKLPEMGDAESCDAIVGPIYSANDVAAREAVRKAVISPVSQQAGSVTLVADGARPAADIPIVAFIFAKPEVE